METPMATYVYCPHCGKQATTDDKYCPHCGAENPNYAAASPQPITNPRTIAELQQYCAERGMPLERMRFFIGVDWREPKAFGIYQAGDAFVVYKNKADGSRAVRYHGPDEAYAVKELFSKLLEECHNRGIYPENMLKPSGLQSAAPGQVSRADVNLELANAYKRQKKKPFRVGLAIMGVIALVLGGIGIKIHTDPNKPELQNGYYFPALRSCIITPNKIATDGSPTGIYTMARGKSAAIPSRPTGKRQSTTRAKHTARTGAPAR